MPKRRCPACGKTFSGDGETCPHCGAVLPADPGQEQDPWTKKRERDPWEKEAGFHAWETPPEGCGCPKNPAEKRRMKEQYRNHPASNPVFRAAPRDAAENLLVLVILSILALISIYVSLHS
ncbi:MAG: zinc ribbon domain-containing protein [Lachnospiraceae bacterium]